MNGSSRTVERSLSIAAPRADVYRALLDPAVLSRWMYATVRIQPRKGGAYRIDWQDSNVPASAQGEILEMEEDRRLVLSWFMEEDGRETVASFDLEDDAAGTGRTLLRFRHTGLPAGAEWLPRFEMVSMEWDKTLENLRFLLEERHGDAPLFYQRHQVELPATRERTHLQWIAPAALCGWLAQEAFVDPAVGGAIDMLLREGRRVTGLIRAFVPGKHLRLLWDEEGVRSLLGVSFWTVPAGCVMTLTQRSYAVTGADRDRLAEVWQGRFQRLRALLERKPGGWRAAGGKRRIESARTLDAPREEVWKACSDPGALVGWFCDRAEFTLQEGRPYAFLWTGYGETTGRVLAVDPGRSLCLSWEIPSLERSTEVELRLEPDEADPGRTRLLVTHHGWGKGEGWEAELAAYRFGWPSMLARLELYLRERRRGPYRSFLLRGRVSRPISQLWPLISTAEGLASWLGSETAIAARAEGPFRARLPEGVVLEGHVAAVDPGEGIAFRLEAPEPAIVELGWAAEGKGSRLIVSGQTYGAPTSWPMEQRIAWAERLGRLEGSGGQRG